MVGIFGGIVFTSSTYLTKDMKVHAASEWAEHKILGNIPVLERTGGECMTFSLSLTFNRKHTMSFEAGMALLTQYATDGPYFPLIIGGLPIGGAKAPNFVITKAEGDYGIVTPSGRVIHGTATVEFKQYRVSVQSQSAPNAGSNSLLSPLGQVAAAVSGVASSVGGVVNSVTDALGAVGGIIGGISSVTGAIGSVTGALGGITGLAGSIGSLTGAAGSMTGVLNNVGNFVRGVTSTAAIGAQAVQQLTNVPSSIVGVANTFGAVGGFALASGTLASTILPSGIKIPPPAA